jgi:hypothetical protein
VISVVAGIKGVLKAVSVGAKVAKRVDPTEKLRERLKDSAEEVNRELVQVSAAVCRALVAHAVGRTPSDSEVDDLMSAAIGDPSFPHRAYRLLGEAQKSASRRRRAFLASVAFGLPFVGFQDDRRDRVDMVVERLMPDDIELLRLIDEKNRTASPPLTDEAQHIFGRSRVVALIQSLEVRVATTDGFTTEIGFYDETLSDDRRRVDHTAFGSLVTLGCLEIGQSKVRQADWEIRPLVITPLGELLLSAIEELRPGFSIDLSE